MRRAFLILVGFASCGLGGCDTQSTAKLILTVGLNTHFASQPADTALTSDRALQRPVLRTPAFDTFLSTMQELNRLAVAADADAEARWDELINRIGAAADAYAESSPASATLLQQVEEAEAVALQSAAEARPTAFMNRLDTYCLDTFGRPWNRDALEKQAINRLVTDYLVAAEMPADVSEVLALHSVTFPHHAMNVKLYTTIADRLAGEGNLSAGIKLARTGLTFCQDHDDINRLRETLNGIYRDHPGEIGVPMNFAGPTLRHDWLTLSSLRGRPVLIVFWSAADSDSNAFLVRCNELAKRAASTKLELVSVSLDAQRADLEFWYFTHGAPCRHLFSAEHAGSENPIAAFYGVTDVPEFFLIDHEGFVIARGTDNLDMIERTLNQLAKPQLAVASRVE